MRASNVAAIVLFSALGVAPAAAQVPYPTRPIHIVVPFPAGGPSDVLSRMMGERMSKDSRPGHRGRQPAGRQHGDWRRSSWPRLRPTVTRC